jgi:hypothetical protein
MPRRRPLRPILAWLTRPAPAHPRPLSALQRVLRIAVWARHPLPPPFSASIGSDVVVLRTDHADWRVGDSTMYVGVLARTATVYELSASITSADDAGG